MHITILKFLFPLLYYASVGPVSSLIHCSCFTELFMQLIVYSECCVTATQQHQTMQQTMQLEATCTTYTKWEKWTLHRLTLAERKELRCGLKERTGWSATRFRNLSRAFILVSTNSSEKRSTTPFMTNFSGSGWRWSELQEGGQRTSRECKWSISLCNCRTEGCVVADLTYGDEVGWLAVLQLDPQPVEVLVAPSHTVLRQVELYPCCLKRNKFRHTFVVLLEGYYVWNTSFWLLI